MFNNAIHATVTRIIQDKILLGLVIVCILGVFVGGFTTKEQAPASPKRSHLETASEPQSPGATPVSSAYASAQLDPHLATDFVKWWMSGAMDFSQASAIKNHDAAFSYMTPEALQTFRSGFWTPTLAAGVSRGSIVGAFQPISVQADAINPDGSIVVTLQGTLVTQSSGHPITQQLQMDLLVRKQASGLRIAGIYNRMIAIPGSSVY
jgi:hypothetical protein